MDFLQKHWLKRKQQHDGWTNHNVTINYYDKLCLPVIPQNKKHLSKQVVMHRFFSDKVKKDVWYTLAFVSLPWISRGKKTKWILLVCMCVFILFHREGFFRLQDVQDILEGHRSTILCCEYSSGCFYQVLSSLLPNLSYFISKDVTPARRKTRKEW